ncbi:MAG: lysophospholipase [Eggerthellaceae bacterium]|jgi:alpha-beta hydrolase superfamily lysophospholipase|nr:lysophospholipase [Eggerthellaceae bacterium]MDR2721814.1 lysophospholipase [Coriobacteriaceae bacterium]
MRSDERVTPATPRVTVTKLGFLSQDKTTQIKALMFSPANGKGVTPKAIIHLAHGMEEHSGRYTDFAHHLASQGFVVCAADMLGHGLSVTDSEKLSCIPAKNGKEILLEDVHELRKTIAARFSRQTPYFVFGHSMGSFLMRAYVTRYGGGLAGAVFCGTGYQSVPFLRVSNLFSKLLAKLKGEDYKSALLEDLCLGAYAKKIENSRTALDWLCTDDAVVDAYIADSLSGNPFSAGGYITLTDLAAEVGTKASAKKLPQDLPILLIGGALDPVGDEGKGVKKVANLLKNEGIKHVDVILYEGMRHEIFNEPDKEKVYGDLVEWFDSRIAAL